ncbi:hypothetical protein SDC9_69411 [bioreactor metagenome]|uniref:Uncharacterized protein n=1 Tax=bioreactor metagenome TaxID=1076179 RepID=A0A644Y329_9ZZZZ
MDGHFAVRAAFLFGWFRFSGFGALELAAERSGGVDRLDDKKQHERHNEEIENGRDERAVADAHAADLPDEVGKVGIRYESDQGRYDVVHQ